ncbi:hypothetical protein [Natrinema sp. SYSU A 869]|uniref:hypothetical protein n=1 Tax=Natrinema sp. SYSU A 869 TaxID=2871694 RepID=UPI002108092E|nr:hypothetical protein [Natrinema sp. SYSU A 869]
MGSDSSDQQPLVRELEALRDHVTALEDRVTDLEAECDRKNERIAALEEECDQKDGRITDLEHRLTECESRATETNRAAEAALRKAAANKDRVRELQSRELEKGAHLRTDTVTPHEIRIAGDRLEKFTKDDGRPYYRVPDSSDPLDGTDTVALAHGDLLPIQQLARMDADMRRSTANSLPTRLAAKLWQARTDPTVGDDPWMDGCKSIDEYVTASDLKHWIRRQEDGISETYAKKLVSRTIDAVLELSKHRLAVRKRTQRKNSLEYTERRVILPRDAEIPGETTAPSASTGINSHIGPDSSTAVPTDSSTDAKAITSETASEDS